MGVAEDPQQADKPVYIARERIAQARTMIAEGRAKDTPDWGPAPWDQIKAEGLQTASGKIEFVASSLVRLEATGTVDPETWDANGGPGSIRIFNGLLIGSTANFSWATAGGSAVRWQSTGRREELDTREVVGVVATA